MPENLNSITPDLSSSPIPVWKQRLLRLKQRSPVKGQIQFGDLRRVTPISQHFGYDRGLPVDRYYIENFLRRHTSDIQGRVLEIGDDFYTRKFGGDQVTHRDVLHVKKGNPLATFVGDLTDASQIPSNLFDCFILTQTLQFIYDVPNALKTIHRILKPGGVVLTTFSGISQTPSDEWGGYHYWNFTRLSAHRLFETVFPADQLQIESHGNVLAAIAFLSGTSFDELAKEELDYCDRSYEVIITVRASKPLESHE